MLFASILALMMVIVELFFTVWLITSINELKKRTAYLETRTAFTCSKCGQSTTKGDGKLCMDCLFWSREERV